VVEPRHVPEKDAHLTVVGLAQSPAPLTRHADGLGSLLGEAGRVEDEHGIGFADPRADLGGEGGHQGFVIPRHLTDELLQPLAALVVQVGDALAGLGVERGDQAPDVLAGVGPLFGFGQGWDERLEELVELG